MLDLWWLGPQQQFILDIETIIDGAEVIAASENEAMAGVGTAVRDGSID